MNFLVSRQWYPPWVLVLTKRVFDTYQGTVARIRTAMASELHNALPFQALYLHTAKSPSPPGSCYPSVLDHTPTQGLFQDLTCVFFPSPLRKISQSLQIIGWRERIFISFNLNRCYNLPYIDWEQKIVQSWVQLFEIKKGFSILQTINEEKSISLPSICAQNMFAKHLTYNNCKQWPMLQ